MNMQNLRENYPRLIFYMTQNGYSESYVARFRREIKRILLLSGSKGWGSYTDVYLSYAKTSHSQSYLRNKRTIIGTIENFDTFGQYPDGRRRHGILRRTGYNSLSEEFKSVINCYCKTERIRGKKESTIYTESHNATSFLLSLQHKGMDTLEKITEQAVINVFTSSDGKVTRSCSYKKNIAAVFKACAPFFPEGSCTRILSFLPALREKRKNIQYLTSEEISRIKTALTAEESSLSLRNKAIGLLTLYTGLRCCDIAALTMDSIDWTNDRLHIRQQKTDVPLELPLTTVVGNAIYDYLTRERHQVDHLEIFISQCHPYDGLKSRSMSNVANKIMKAANVRGADGDRKGFHIFRHHLATALLGNGIPQPVISRTLGHSSPASLDTYLSADFSHLRECSLSIEQFPLRKGVLV